MAASCASNDSSDRGFGCTEAGACSANGGIDIREAKGAEVSGMRVASGSHGAVAVAGQHHTHPRMLRGSLVPCRGASCLKSFEAVSAALLGSALALPVDIDGTCLRSGLFVLDVKVSRVVTVCFSVRRSLSSADRMLFTREVPDNVLLCGGRSDPDPGESVPAFCDLDSNEVLVVLSRVFMRGIRDDILLGADMVARHVWTRS